MSYKAPAFTAFLMADGTASGYVYLASTLGFAVGAKVWISSSLVAGVECVVTEVGRTRIRLRLSSVAQGSSTMATYLLADAARVDQQEQIADGEDPSFQRLTQALSGTPTFLGVIVATTTKNNHTTATPFQNTGTGLGGFVLVVQADAACYIFPGITNAATVTGTATGNGVLLAAGERVLLTMAQAQGWLACVAVAGTANLKVWSMG